MEKVYVTDYPTGADQIIPNWAYKTMFPGKVETPVRLGIKPWFDDVSSAQATPFKACYFFLTL